MFMKALVLSGLAAIASAHITMTNPIPFGKSSLTNSPMLADGSDFPCKQRTGVYEAEGASNVYKQGSTQQLSFQGTAVHGGGSCQVSVTKDLKPTKDSVWKVIKSIEGGCPAKGQAGNMGSDASAAVPFKYDFDIPKELAAGNYTLAWTWFNKVGNREMYMNCAPMTVQGSGGSDSFVESLPDMFVANVGNGCATKPSTDLEFPNPGKDVDKFNGATSAFDVATGTGCQAGSTGGTGPAPTSGGGDAKPTDAQPSPQPSTAPADTATPSVPGGVFVTVPDSQPAASQPAATQPAATSVGSQPATSPAQPTSAPDVPDTPAPSSAPSAAPSSGSGSGSEPPAGGSGGAHAAGTACSSEGMWNCIGGNSFQRCASGMWSATQNMAAGVSCTAGESAELAMSARRGKRAMRRALRV